MQAPRGRMDHGSLVPKRVAAINSGKDASAKGFRTTVEFVGVYNGLANCPIPPPGVRNQELTFG
jgi:hypothetical protein